MHNDFYFCGHSWTDEWHASLEHCTLGLDPCPGRILCKSFIKWTEWEAIQKAKEEESKAKLWLVADIPYEDVEDFARKWFAEHNELNISWGEE